VTGLRDAKRAAVARSLARIAFGLVRDRGLGGVTVEEIVAEAEVSRRTFSNYYPSKEAAVAAVVVHQVEAALAAWAPPESADMDVLDIARLLVDHQLRTGTLAILTEVAALSAEHPQLVPYVRDAQWKVWSAVGDRILTAIPAPDSSDAETVQLVVGGLFGIVSAGLNSTGIRDSDAAPRLHESVHRGLARLEQGLGRPRCNNCGHPHMKNAALHRVDGS